MKKLFILFMFVILLSSCDSEIITDCKENENIGGICVDLTEPVFSGMDNITIEKGTFFDPLLDVTAIDDLDGDLTSEISVLENVDINEYGTYIVRYVVEDTSANIAIGIRYITVTYGLSNNDHSNLVLNGDFSNGFSGFGTYTINGNGDASFDVVDEELVINIFSIQENVYYVPRLQYENMLFEEGSTYLVSFKIKSTHERMIHIQIGELLSETPWFTDFNNGGEKLYITNNEYQVISFIFRMDNPTNYNGAILFEMGGIGDYIHETTIYLI